MPSQQLPDAFGPLSQRAPLVVQRDEPSPMVDPVLVPEVLPPTPSMTPSGVVLVPTKRIDGSLVDAPWGMSESAAWNWLMTADIEVVEERVLWGVGGSLWARCRNEVGELRSVLLRFDTVGFDVLYRAFSAEYGLSIETHDVLRREQVAYEVAKAFGCEDLAPPIAARVTNLVPLISDAVRDRVAAKYGIDPNLVDESFGTVGAAQLVPLNASNFVEYWAMLGPDFKSQFQASPDALRHGLYRMMALDFILGTGNRLLSDLLYNKATGTVCVYGLGVTFPNPIASADRYLAERAKGWERRAPYPTETPKLGAPACSQDTIWLSDNFGDREREECLATFKQMAKEFSEPIAVLVCQIAEELGVPKINIAGMLARVVFLQEDPDTTMVSHFDYMRSVIVPMRRGYGFDQGRNLKIVTVVNQIMTDAFGEPFDFSTAMQEVEQPQQ